MAYKTKAVVKEVKIVDIRVGDKLGQDIIGQGEKTLIHAGTVINVREITFLRKQMAQKQPKYAPERYTLGVKTPGAIYSQNGACLVKSGQVVTAEALAPLLEEGFEEMPTTDNGTMYFRKNEWPDGKPWRIDQFNPSVRVETVAYVNDDGKELEDPRGAHVKVGTTAQAATAKTAKIAQTATKKPAAKKAPETAAA